MPKARPKRFPQKGAHAKLKEVWGIVSCPQCGVAPGVRCYGGEDANGVPFARSASHKSRWEKARNMK